MSLIKIHNIATHKIIEREMTNEEIAEQEAIKAAQESAEQDAITKAKAKAALLEKLGLTEDEAKLLLS
jgi:uncharacterized membrane protein YkoI